ncbi:unnamed protein product [Macrosiphum euphorbiae]|uniref:Uncharacterized protein n=1 Tax=Macrosiphum euphorbiae TaxID=13131 RepID=A0AAV0WMI1_9HEMI|nr:unnamed protein product [Macrosiphum euphorbiae]
MPLLSGRRRDGETAVNGGTEQKRNKPDPKKKTKKTDRFERPDDSSLDPPPTVFYTIVIRSFQASLSWYQSLRSWL